LAQTQINGNTQIQAATIPLSKLVSGYSIPTSNLVDGANFVKKDGSVTMTAALNFGGFTGQNSGAPTNASDLATKAYVDAKTGGIGGLHDVRILSASNVASLSGLTAIDGVTPVANDLILLTAQSTASQNGPWAAASGSWTRPSWWTTATVVNEGQYFMVAEGTSYKDTKWWCTNTGTITVDTTSTTFVQDNSGTTYTNGTGLSLAGGTFSVNYGTTSTTAAVGNDARITGALQTSSLGTNVLTALGVAVGSVGAFVTYNGALGTPSGGSLANCSGLSAATGLTGTLATAAVPAFTGGDVTSVGGSLSLTVNNTSGTGFVKYGNFIWNETPTGLVNGSNVTYTLAHSPANSGVALSLELNGITLEPGSGNDYTISGTTVTMLFTPQTGDKLRAYYLY